MRERILDVTAETMRANGLAETTTRVIARKVPCSEATLYRHFTDKEGLFLAVLAERMPTLTAVITDMPARAGSGRLFDNLQECALLLVEFLHEVVPVMGSLFADPALLTEYAKALHVGGNGIATAHGAIADYLRAEQKLGRANRQVSADGVAALLLGACHQFAFSSRLHPVGNDSLTPAVFARIAVTALMEGIAPAKEDTREH